MTNTQDIAGSALAPLTGSATTWYKTGSSYDWTIKEETVARSTNDSVWVWNDWSKKDERRSRRSEYATYWTTREEAVAHLIARAEAKKAAAERTRQEMVERIEALSQNV